MKRPVGITVLALLLGLLAIGAFVLTLTAETLAELHVRWQLVRIGALVYGLTSAVAAVGLWKRRHWGYLAFLAWAAAVLTMVLWWPAVFPRPVLPWWGALLWVPLMAIWLLPLAGYVRRAVAGPQ
jgi:uncharacterized membrane protein (DUF2068 family)